jgi:hypothetical protein
MAIKHWKRTPMKVDNDAMFLNENIEAQVKIQCALMGSRIERY